MATIIGYIDRQLTETLPSLALTPLCKGLKKMAPSLGKAPGPVVTGVLETTKLLGNFGIPKLAPIYPVSAFALCMRQIHIALLERTAQADFVEDMATKVKQLAARIKGVDDTVLDTIPSKIREALNEDGSPAPVTHAELLGAVARKGVNSLAAWTVRTVVFVGIPYYITNSSTLSYAFTATSIILLHYSLASRARSDLQALSESKTEPRTLTDAQRESIIGKVEDLTDDVPRKFKQGLGRLSFAVSKASFASLPKPEKKPAKPKSAAAAPAAAQADPGTSEFWKVEYNSARALLDKFDAGSEEKLVMEVRMFLAARNYYQSIGNTAKADKKEALWHEAVEALAAKAQQASSAPEDLSSDDDAGAGVPVGKKGSTKSKKTHRHRRHSEGASAAKSSPRKKASKKEKTPPPSPSSSSESEGGSDDAIILSGSESD